MHEFADIFGALNARSLRGGTSTPLGEHLARAADSAPAPGWLLAEADVGVCPVRWALAVALSRGGVLALDLPAAVIGLARVPVTAGPYHAMGAEWAVLDQHGAVLFGGICVDGIAGYLALAIERGVVTDADGTPIPCAWTATPAPATPRPSLSVWAWLADDWLERRRRAGLLGVLARRAGR